MEGSSGLEYLARGRQSEGSIANAVIANKN